jgi:beta-glucanase (GH16 family)
MSVNEVVGETLSSRPSSAPRRRWRGSAVLAIALIAATVASALTAHVLAPEPAGEWRSIFREDFRTPVPVGEFPGSVYGPKFTTYPGGWADTSGLGQYRPEQVLSVSEGALTWNMREESGLVLGAAVLPTLPTYGQTYGQYSIRFRADTTPGFGMAFLLWPDSEKWPRDGEIDFPEGEFSGVISGNAHRASASGEVDRFPTTVDFSEWRVATIQWRPTGVTFLLDGVVIGESTIAVPSRSMHWVLQTGSAGETPAAPNSFAQVQVDWLEAFARNEDAPNP